MAEAQPAKNVEGTLTVEGISRCLTLLKKVTFVFIQGIH